MFCRSRSSGERRHRQQWAWRSACEVVPPHPRVPRCQEIPSSRERGAASGMSSMANSDQNTKRATNSRRPPLSKGKTSSRTSGRENEGRKLYHSLTVPVSTTFATERLKQQRALAKSERNATSLNGDSRAKASQSTGNDGSARLPLSHKNAHQVTNFMIDRKAV